MPKVEKAKKSVRYSPYTVSNASKKTVQRYKAKQEMTAIMSLYKASGIPMNIIRRIVPKA